MAWTNVSHEGNIQLSTCQVFEKNVSFGGCKEIAYNISLCSSHMKKKGYYSEGKKMLLVCTVVVLIVVLIPYSCLKSDTR